MTEETAALISVLTRERNDWRDLARAGANRGLETSRERDEAFELIARLRAENDNLRAVNNETSALISICTRERDEWRELAIDGANHFRVVTGQLQAEISRLQAENEILRHTL